MLRALLSISLVIPLLINAQIKQLSPAMEWRLAAFDDSDFPLFVDFVDGGKDEMIKHELGIVLGSVGEYTLIRTDKAKVLQMVHEGLYDYIGLDFDSGRPLNDQMILNNNILPLHQGVSPLNQSLTGEGVVMGVVDSGVELDHPDFMHDDGSTRIVKLWDQLYIYDDDHIPDNYGWGTEWSEEEIDSDVSVHVDQPQWYGHGSTVTGTACGNGTAVDKYIGVAPESDMVIVSFDFSRPSFRANVASSIQYVFEVADEIEKPAVVNLSLGSYFGSHDGLDPAALYIDSLLEAQPGRLAVAAIGNSNNLDPYHLRVELENDTAFTWFEVEDNLFIGNYGVYMELWTDTADFSDVEFTFGADEVEDGYENRGTSDWLNYEEFIGTTVTKDIVNQDNDLLGNVQYWAQLRGEQIQLQAMILQPDSSDYAFRFMSRGNGSYDIWSTATFGTSDMIQEEDLPTIEEFPDIERYRAPDRLQHMVDSWTCSDKVISVANYTNRVEYLNYLNEITTVDGTQGDIYLTSSAGPTRDGRLKPDLAATGSTTLSTGNFAMLASLIQNEPFKVAPEGMHFRNGGSSMASPVVAGVAALFLQQCPGSDWEDFKNALYATTAVDGYTGEVPNPRWGMGKVNGYGAVAFASIEAIVEQIGDSLFTSGGAAYQWYLDGELLTGMNNEYLIAEVDGNYQVEVFNADGCSRLSQISVFTDIENLESLPFQVYPNPTDDYLTLSGLNSWSVLRLSDSYGRSIPLVGRWIGSNRLDIHDLSKGVYFIQVESGSHFRTLRVIKE